MFTVVTDKDSAGINVQAVNDVGYSLTRSPKPKSHQRSKIFFIQCVSKEQNVDFQNVSH